jgi:hypothetical protein
MQVNDLQAMYLEYQTLAVQVEFQSNFGDSASGNALHPELILYTDNEDANPPTTVQIAEAHNDVTRHVMDGSKIIRRNFIPRPSFNLFGTGLSTDYAYLANPRAMWLNLNASADAPHYAFKGLFRQFPLSLTQTPAIRIALTVWLACRRQH